MTPDQARSEVHTLLENASNVIGGEWYVEEGALPEQCDVSGSGDGVFWNGGRRQEGHEDADTPTTRIIEYWRSQGYAVQAWSFAHDHRGVSAETPTGARLIYDLDIGTVVINADGPCVVGDWRSIQQTIADTLPAPYDEYYGTPAPAAHTPEPAPSPEQPG